MGPLSGCILTLDLVSHAFWSLSCACIIIHLSPLRFLSSMPGGFHPTKEAFLAWPKPNYIDPETKGNQLLVVTIISTILAIASVLARVWVRIGYQRQFGADDVMLVLCIVCACPVTLWIDGLARRESPDTNYNSVRFPQLELPRF